MADEATPLIPAANRQEAMLLDPLLGGNLLLIGLAWDYLLAHGARKITGVAVGRLTGLDEYRYRDAVHSDIPRYDPPARPRACQVVGPRGGTCSRRACHVRALADLDDGTVTWLAACTTPAHRLWFERRHNEYARSVEIRRPPKPAYNTRSKVAHHFPEIDFPVWWAMLDHRRESYDVYRDPAQGGDLVRQRPRLRVVMSA